MKKSKSIKDNYKKNTVCLNLFNLVIFFFLNNAQIASWDGLKRESVVFTSAYLRSKITQTSNTVSQIERGKQNKQK